MGAFLKPGDGYLYSLGTPSGRSGPAFLSRVPPALVPELSRYEYWDADATLGPAAIRVPPRR